MIRYLHHFTATKGNMTKMLNELLFCSVANNAITHWHTYATDVYLMSSLQTVHASSTICCRKIDMQTACTQILDKQAAWSSALQRDRATLHIVIY